MTRLAVLNFRRTSRYHGAKVPRCCICFQKVPYYTDGPPGDSVQGSLEHEQELSGACSRRCFAILYGLLDGKGGYVCLCGAPVAIPGADCPDCHREAPEDGAFIYRKAGKGYVRDPRFTDRARRDE